MAKSPTASMRYDVMAKKYYGDITGHIKDLKRIKSFLNYTGFESRGEYAHPIDKNKVIIYIILLYSHDSVLNTKPVTPLKERKLKAAEWCSMPRKSSNREDFTEQVHDQIFGLKNKEILGMIIDYLRFQKQTLWADIAITEQELDELFELRLTSIEKDEKDPTGKKMLDAAKTKDAVADIFAKKRKYLDQCYEEFFPDDHLAKEIQKQQTATRIESLIK